MKFIVNLGSLPWMTWMPKGGLSKTEPINNRNTTVKSWSWTNQKAKGHAHENNVNVFHPNWFFEKRRNRILNDADAINIYNFESVEILSMLLWFSGLVLELAANYGHFYQSFYLVFQTWFIILGHVRITTQD